MRLVVVGFSIMDAAPVEVDHRIGWGFSVTSAGSHPVIPIIENNRIRRQFVILIFRDLRVFWEITSSPDLP